MAVQSSALSIQGVVKESAMFLSTFSSRFAIEVCDLIHADIEISGSESQLYEIFSQLYKSMCMASSDEAWKFTFIIHEVRRLKDELFISPLQKREAYVAFSLLVRSSKDDVVDLFLRTSALHLGMQTMNDEGYVSFFPGVSFVYFSPEGMSINSEFGLVFTAYLPRRVA